MTIIAMLWANSPYHEAYQHFFHTPISLKIGSFVLEHGLLHWINDGLMVIFFFVVGLEIKRELIIGELSSPKKAALPIFAAMGGMIVPALIYHYLNMTGVGKAGWGIPMATDIAFAVGVITLLGKRVPFALKVFLLALAIVDDLGAVLVIAIFYTDSISTMALGGAAVLIITCLTLNKAGVRNLLVYLVLGIFIWLLFLKSGVHATIAGVILGFITPISSWVKPEFFYNMVNSFATRAAESMKKHAEDPNSHTVPDTTVHQLEDLGHLATESISPLDRIIHALHPWVTFFIMPVFALGNAGIYLGGIDLASVTDSSITIGIFLGLLLGKPVGVLLACFLAIKFKISSLPEGVNIGQLTGVGFLAGIGFTMALFVSNLALTPEVDSFSKIGILSASIVAAVIGFVILAASSKKS